jgi:hypothetical protein
MRGEIKLRPAFLKDIGWVIIGGESGKGARPMAFDWAWDLYRDCLDAGVPVYFKQIGDNRELWNPCAGLLEDMITSSKRFPRSFPAEAVAKLGGTQ